MRNEYTQAEEEQYYEAMRERRLEKERQIREDAMDCFDAGGDDEE